MANYFALDTVFLVCECQCNKSGLVQFRSTGSSKGDAMMWAYEKLNILEPKWV
jgi:hypothetical protein